MIKYIFSILLSITILGCGAEYRSNPRSIVLYTFEKYDPVNNVYTPYSNFIWNLQLYYGFSLFKDNCPQAFFTSQDFQLPTILHNSPKSIYGTKDYSDPCFPQNVELKVSLYLEDSTYLYYEVEYAGELFHFRRSK